MRHLVATRHIVVVPTGVKSRPVEAHSVGSVICMARNYLSLLPLIYPKEIIFFVFWYMAGWVIVFVMSFQCFIRGYQVTLAN